MSPSFRVAFLTNLTTSVNLAVLERLIRSDVIELSHVYFYDTIAFGRSSLSSTIQQLGWRRFSVKLLRIFSSRMRIGFGKMLGIEKIKATSCWEFVKIHRLPHSVIADINQQQSIQHLLDLQVDVLVVCVCKNILKSAVLAVPRLAAVNLHPSLLPNYRGPSPTFWMLYHGEQETGMTFHRMTPRIDCGTILKQFSMPLDHRRSEEQIEAELFSMAARHIEEVLVKLADSDVSEEPISEAGSYYSYPTETDRKELLQRQSRNEVSK